MQSPVGRLSWKPHLIIKHHVVISVAGKVSAGGKTSSSLIEGTAEIQCSGIFLHLYLFIQFIIHHITVKGALTGDTVCPALGGTHIYVCVCV